MSRMYKELLQLNSKNTQPTFFNGQGLEQAFLKETLLVTSKHMKKRSTSFVVRETQI